jgi:hypothetical protein
MINEIIMLMENQPFVSIVLGCVVLYPSVKLTLGPNQGLGALLGAAGLALSIIMITIPIITELDSTDQNLKTELSQAKDEKRLGAEELAKAVELVESEGDSVVGLPKPSNINDARKLVEQAGYQVIQATNKNE